MLDNHTYDTNMQDRDIDDKYPTFLYSDGYTDTDLYQYDNASADRGRDPRSVYRRDQDRQTMIGVLKSGYSFDFGLKVEGKFKYIRDDDFRKIKKGGKVHSADDYLGNIYIGRVEASMPVAPSLTLALGGQYDRWDEVNRSGDQSGGYGDYLTEKWKAFSWLAYRWGGASVNYYIEYLYKDQDRPEEMQLDDQLWKVWRSKATFEVAW